MVSNFPSIPISVEKNTKLALDRLAGRGNVLDRAITLRDLLENGFLDLGGLRLDQVLDVIDPGTVLRPVLPVDGAAPLVVRLSIPSVIFITPADETSPTPSSIIATNASTGFIHPEVQWRLDGVNVGTGETYEVLAFPE